MKKFIDNFEKQSENNKLLKCLEKIIPSAFDDGIFNLNKFIDELGIEHTHTQRERESSSVLIELENLTL